MPPEPLKDDLRKRSAADLRAERDALGGWIRQPEVRWLDPGILAKAGVEVAVSGTFGKFADKREIQTQPQGPFDYSGAGELWIDYLSDTGDGWAATQTMAWLLAQPHLTVEGSDLPRGDVLLLGGDQVYPSATPEAYEDRFKGPFAAALPISASGSEPHMYATPGNHDWYDGLVSFLRLFCAGGWIGGWRTRQRRSYFALRLPNRWWVLAIDIQLDTYIDDVQLQYFSELGLSAGDKVILLTAKPSWVAAVDGRVEPPSWRFLNFFEERIVRDSGARLVVTLTGDRHHYARYEPEGEGAQQAPTRITAGGGGAYLSATHTLPEQVLLKTLPRRKEDDKLHEQAPVISRRAEIYPGDKDSRRLSNGILRLALLNPAFGRLLGVVYALIGVTLLSATPLDGGVAIDDSSGATTYAPIDDSFPGFLESAPSTMSILLALLLFGGIYSGLDIKPSRSESSRRGVSLVRFVVALAHTLVHLLAVCLVIWLAADLALRVWDVPVAAWLLGLPVAFLVGKYLGATVFALFMWLVHKARGPKSQATANQVFTGQSIIDYKNLLRMCVGRDGGLEIHALGVDAACTTWDLADEQGSPGFEPRRTPPQVHAIDRTLRFDSAGDRIA